MDRHSGSAGSPERYVIPSSNRADTLARQTLRLLWRLGVDDELIDVWVPPEQREQYASLRRPLFAAPSPPSLTTARNAIALAYPVGTRLVQFDDDVTEMMIGWKGRKLTPVTPEQWTEVLDYAWHQCDLLGTSLWGGYSVCNDFYMRPNATTDLRLIGGWFFGLTLRGGEAEQLLLSTGEKEDHERTLRLFLRDGGVLRLNWLAARTSYMSGTGGLQDYRTIYSNAADARRLAEAFPTLTTYVDQHGSRQSAEVKLRRCGGVSSPLPLPSWVDASDDPQPASRRERLA